MSSSGSSDTIAAIATAPGRGAIAIVRLSGSQARRVAERIFRGGALLDRTARFGTIVGTDGRTIDTGLALFFRGPRSYTGEDVVELHVHGAPVVARDVVLAALANGARLAEAGEFTRRAWHAGKIDLDQAEAVADLIAAEHSGAARAAAARLGGGLADRVERQAGVLATMLEELTAALDFPDEVEAPGVERLRETIGGVDAELAELARDWERGRLVREGMSVAIVGPPNAGKSSLLNALLGAERALVSAVAGTTRDTIEETLALGAGAVARIVDTAGLRTPADALEAAGIARSERALAEASVALVVIDGSRALDADARAVLHATRDRARVVYFSKRDLGREGYDAREAAEADALFGAIDDAAALAAVRGALAAHALGERPDVARAHLGTARQAQAVLAARRALGFAVRSLDAGAPVDLLAGDLAEARRALGELTGRDANEALLDGIFARFCIGK